MPTSRKRSRVSTKRARSQPARKAASVSDMTVSQLKKLAAQRGIPVAGNARKADLVAALSGGPQLESASLAELNAALRQQGLPKPRSCKLSGKSKQCREDILDSLRSPASAAAPIKHGAVEVTEGMPAVATVKGGRGRGAGIMAGKAKTYAAAELATVDIADVNTAFAGAPKVAFNIRASGGAANIAALESSAYEVGAQFLVDKQCAVEGGSLVARTGRTSALLQHCEIVGGKADCNHGLLHAEALHGPQEVDAWKARVQDYRTLAYALPEFTLPFKAAWTCDSTQFQYQVGRTWLGRAKMAAGDMTGFVAVEVPKGYTLWPLREFMRSYADPSRSKFGLQRLYNWVTSLPGMWGMVQSRYFESMVPDLIELLYTAGVVPNEMSPEIFGVLVKDGVALDYTPVILPLPAKMVGATSPENDPAMADKMKLDQKAIYDAVVGGYLAVGGAKLKASYKPSWSFATWATLLGTTIGGAAVTAAASMPFWGPLVGVGIESGTGLLTVGGVAVAHTVSVGSFVTAIQGAASAVVASASWSTISGSMAAYGSWMAAQVVAHPWVSFMVWGLASQLAASKFGGMKASAAVRVLNALVAAYATGVVGMALTGALAGYEGLKNILFPAQPGYYIDPGQPAPINPLTQTPATKAIEALPIPSVMPLSVDDLEAAKIAREAAIRQLPGKGQPLYDPWTQSPAPGVQPYTPMLTPEGKYNIPLSESIRRWVDQISNMARIHPYMTLAAAAAAVAAIVVPMTVVTRVRTRSTINKLREKIRARAQGIKSGKAQKWRM